MHVGTVQAILIVIIIAYFCLLPLQTSPSTVTYPSLQEHIVAVRLMHSVVAEFSPHTSLGEADVMQSPLELQKKGNCTTLGNGADLVKSKKIIS